MAYFTAVLARSGAHWKARDLEVDEYSSLDDLADAMRGVAHEDEPVLAVVEHEDEWFAVVRTDGEDDPRVFVSDLFAASRSPYADLLAPAADVDDDDEDDEAAGLPGSAGAAAEEDDDEADDDPPAAQDDEEIVLDAWAGESDLLEDLGVSGKQLREWVEEHAEDPGLVLGQVGDVLGFADQLEALR